MINISARLKKISELVSDNSRLVDIGCDHGLTDIYIYNTCKNVDIIASDVNKNALNNAIANIKKYNLEKKIKTILSDGLDNIDTSDRDTILISGMGAHTIMSILLNNKNKLKTIDTLIIQSNNDLYFLRKNIIRLGYFIDSEVLVKEKKYIYTIIRFKRGIKRYSYRELYFGPILMKENSNLFKEKNMLELEKLYYLYKLIPFSHIKLKIKSFWKIRMYKNIIGGNYEK